MKIDSKDARLGQGLEALVESAKNNNNTVEYMDIYDAFPGIDLTEEQFEEVVSQLGKEGIQVSQDADVIDSKDLTPDNSRGMGDSLGIYLREIARYPLLTQEEETELAKKIEAGKKAESELEGFKKEHEGPIEGAGDEIKAWLKELENTVKEGKEAKDYFQECNLRLVVSVAKRYLNHSMSFLDLIQEGNIGLIRAVDAFDYRRGFKFSTYATWWIRQGILRAIANHSKTIRLPVHMYTTVSQLNTTVTRLTQALDRRPTTGEIAEEMGVAEERVLEIMKYSRDTVSLETPVGENEDAFLGDFLEDESATNPEDAAIQSSMQEIVMDAVNTLPEKERKIIVLRFGLEGERPHTLEEVGQQMDVTRERIRQIESKALRKLRGPSRGRALRNLL